MDAYIDQIKSAIGNVITEFLAVAASPKPTYSIEGQSVSHGEYMRMLLDSLKSLFELLLYVEPYELRSSGI